MDSVGLTAIASAPWLTQLTELSLHEDKFASVQSNEDFLDTLNDDAWVFGRLRRLGCHLDSYIVHADAKVASDSSSDDDSDGDSNGDSDD